MSGYTYLRFNRPEGLQYREQFSHYWHRVTPEMLAGMSSHDLRRVADVLDGKEPKQAKDK